MMNILVTENLSNVFNQRAIQQRNDLMDKNNKIPLSDEQQAEQQIPVGDTQPLSIHPVKIGRLL